MQNAEICMCSAMCCASELQRAIRMVCVACRRGLHCAVAIARSASSVPVAAVCIAAARAALARMRFCRGKKFLRFRCILPPPIATGRLAVAVASHVTEMVTLLLTLVTESTHTITRHCANYTCYQQRHTSRGAGHLEMGQRHLLEHPD